MKTKNTRIPEWIFNLFSAKAKEDGKSFVEKIDEAVEALNLLNISEIRLENWLLELYKNDEKKRPRFLYETLQAMFNYWDKLEKDFNFPDFFQFVDRWSIATYYIHSHLYTNQLSKEQLRDDELSARTESSIALAYFLGKEGFDEFVSAMTDVKAYPYSYAALNKKSKAVFLHEVFSNNTMKALLLSPEVTKRESALYSLIKDISKNRNLNFKKNTSSKFPIFVNSRGLINKIAYFVYIYQKNEEIKTLPYFVDEKFLGDIVNVYHAVLLQERNELFHSNALASIFKIAIATLEISEPKNDISYLKSNLIDGYAYESLADALKVNLEVIENDEFLSDGAPEMLTRTPMHIINDIIDERVKFIRRPELFDLFTKNLINIVLPVYKYLIHENGPILESSNYYASRLSLHNNDETIQLEVRVDDGENSCIYSNIILYVNDGRKTDSKFGMTITLHVNHESLTKLNYILHSEKMFSNVRLEEELYVSKNQLNDFAELRYKDSSTYFLHNQILDDLKDILRRYVESEEFKRLNQIYIIKHGVF